MEAYGREQGFPLIGPLVGRLLWMLARTAGAKRVFECGSGYGYSAMWFADAVGPDGEVFLTDGSAENVERARDFLGRAGLADRCRFLEGEAVSLLGETEGPFDVILVDIDKEGYPGSLDVTVGKLRSGGLLVTDNVLWSGRVADEEPDSYATGAIQEHNRLLYAHPDLDTVILPLRDGVAVCRKR
jgi:predicted O-methyltransferase YrrM